MCTIFVACTSKEGNQINVRNAVVEMKHPPKTYEDIKAMESFLENLLKEQGTLVEKLVITSYQIM